MDSLQGWYQFECRNMGVHQSQALNGKMVENSFSSLKLSQEIHSCVGQYIKARLTIVGWWKIIQFSQNISRNSFFCWLVINEEQIRKNVAYIGLHSSSFKLCILQKKSLECGAHLYFETFECSFTGRKNVRMRT